MGACQDLEGNDYSQFQGTTLQWRGKAKGPDSY